MTDFNSTQIDVEDVIQIDYEKQQFSIFYNETTHQFYVEDWDQENDDVIVLDKTLLPIDIYGRYTIDDAEMEELEKIIEAAKNDTSSLISY